jgi:hypothetical protein
VSIVFIVVDTMAHLRSITKTWFSALHRDRDGRVAQWLVLVNSGVKALARAVCFDMGEGPLYLMIFTHGLSPRSTASVTSKPELMCARVVCARARGS